MSPEEIAKHTERAIEAMRAQIGHKNTFVDRMLCEPVVIAAAVSAYLADPMSDEEYYAAHDCPTCDPVEHCSHE